MSFINQFQSYFTPEEQNTDLYKIYAAIGLNMERGLMEHLSAIINETTDVNSFSSELAQSWLGFFMKKIRGRTAPRTIISVSCEKPEPPAGSAEDYGNIVVVPKGTVLTTPSGNYIQMKDLRIRYDSDTLRCECVQGRQITANSENYHEFVKFKTVGIDLSTLVVKLNNIEIPEISFNRSYTGLNYVGNCYIDEGNHVRMTIFNEYTRVYTYVAGMTYYEKQGSNYVQVTVDASTDFITNQYYWKMSEKGLNDLDPEKGDYLIMTNAGTCFDNIPGLYNNYISSGTWIMFDGNDWILTDPIEKSFLPYQLEKLYGIPYNGYYAYVIGDQLYLKIFSGPSFGDPEGQTVTIEYISTEGSSGQINSNCGMKYTQSFNNDLGNSSTISPDYFTITNTKSTSGVDDIQESKLGLLLKDSFFSGITISSVPEYTHWFRAQPEVGDAYVWSDFEKYLRQGNINDLQTGYVYIMALDNNGDAIKDDPADSDDLASKLIRRIEPYKDIADLKILSPLPMYNFFQVTFGSASDTALFRASIEKEIINHYTLSYVQQHDESLFQNLDMNTIYEALLTDNVSEGLDIEGYHIVPILMDGGLVSSTIINLGVVSDNEAPSGAEYYFCPFNNPDESQTLFEKYVETIDYNDLSRMSIINQTGVQVAQRYDNKIILAKQFNQPGLLLCKIPMYNTGILTIALNRGYRKLFSPKMSEIYCPIGTGTLHPRAIENEGNSPLSGLNDLQRNALATIFGAGIQIEQISVSEVELNG